MKNPNARTLSDQAIIQILASGQDALAIFTGENFTIAYANDKMLAYWNKDESLLGLPLDTLVPDILQQTLADGLKLAWQRGSNYQAEQVPVTVYISGQQQIQMLNFKYEPFQDDYGHTKGILLRVTNPPATVRNDQLSDIPAKDSNLEVQLNESDKHFRRFVEQAPVAVMVLIGKDLVMEAANQLMLDILHQNKSILGRPILESMPELKNEVALHLLFHVFQTGKATQGVEVPIRIVQEGQSELRYFNFNYHPLVDDGQVIGVMNLAVEVTSQVKNRQSLEAIIAEKTELEKTLRDSEQRLQGILDTMAEGVGIVDATG